MSLRCFVVVQMWCGLGRQVLGSERVWRFGCRGALWFERVRNGSVWRFCASFK